MIHCRSRARRRGSLARTLATVATISATGVATTALAIASSASAAPRRAAARATTPLVSTSTTGGGATITLSGPAVVRPGGTVRLHLDVTGAPDVAALQASLRYDHHALEVSRVQFAGSLEGLQSADLADRTEIGAWSQSVPSMPAAAAAGVQHVVAIDVEPLAWVACSCVSTSSCSLPATARRSRRRARSR